MKPRQDVEVTVIRDSGEELSFTARCRIDTYNELEYFQAGGILQYVLRKLAAHEQGKVTALQLGIEVAGWAGAALILLAYLLLSAGRLTGQSLVFQSMNIVGAAGFVVNSWWHGAVPSATLNVLWLLIGVIASWRIISKRGSSTSAM